MSVDDFATMLAYLMRVCWSAAAGQLHLASIGDSEPSSPVQSLRGKPSPSPAPPDGKITRLRAGICAQQETVGAKVCVRVRVLPLSTWPLWLESHWLYL